jgi:hypothetical protein
MSFLQSILTEKQLATALFAFPFLALAIGGAIAQIAIYRADHVAELARLRSVRVVARREGVR